LTTLQQPGEYVAGGGSSTNSDWYVAISNSETRNDSLWKNNGKTIFDPCPAGWVVAPVGTWKDFTTTGGNLADGSPEAFGQNSPFPYYINGTRQTANETPTMVISGLNGRYYTPETGDLRTWYPTAGYRINTTGELTSVGINGYSWASMVSGSSAYNLSFTNARLYPSNVLGHAYSHTLRCLQE
jgi:hypothetical protein